MTAAPQAKIGAALSHAQVLRVLSGVLLGMFLSALDQTIVTTALPTLAADLHGVEHLSWIVSIYLLTATASTPIYGKLSDLYGRRPLLQAAIAIFMVGSLLCALAQSMSQLIAARAIQGLGGGGLVTLAHAVIADVVSPRERGRYQAYLSSVWATASIGGPVLGGVFVDYLSWRWVFGVNLPIGVIAVWLCRRALRDLPRPLARRSIDYLGAALLTGAVTALLLVTTWVGVEYAWGSPQILGLLAAGTVLLLAFLLQELRALEPILPPRLWRNDVFRVANSASFLMVMVMFGSTMLLPIFLQIVGGVSPGRSGLLMTPLTGGSVIGAFAAGRLMRRTGRYKPMLLVGFPLATAALLLLSTMTAETPTALIALYMVMLGAGIGLGMPVVVVATQNAAEPRDIGAATSAVNFFRSLGGSLGAAILWSVLILALSHNVAGTAAVGGLDLLHGGPEGLTRLPSELRAAVLPALTGAFRAVFLAGALLAGLAVVVVLFLREVPLHTVPAAQALARAAQPADTKKAPAD